MKALTVLAVLLLAGCTAQPVTNPVPGALWSADELGDPVAARWSLADPVASPDPGATDLALMIAEVPCSSGSPIEGRTEPPVIETSATSVTITIRVRQLLGGLQTCPLHMWPMTVRLPEPLGNRQLLDGGQVPPAPPQVP
jgi:hypothetical protein